MLKRDDLNEPLSAPHPSRKNKHSQHLLRRVSLNEDSDSVKSPVRRYILMPEIVPERHLTNHNLEPIPRHAALP